MSDEPFDGIRDCLHAEWTKLRTAPDTTWLLAATMVLTVAVSTAATAATRCALAAWAAAALLAGQLLLSMRDA